jgi:hypothetical protein
MDWDEEFTPREHWVSDLCDLFGTEWDIVANDDFDYDFHFSSRKATKFISQVVMARLK